MKLSEFIRENPKTTKILLADKVSVGNALIRRCNLEEGIASFNIITKTPFDLAKEIVDALSEEPVKLCSPEGSVYLMMNSLRDGHSELMPESALSLGTAKEALLCINELRENGVTEAYRKNLDNDRKLQELDKILTGFEKKLSDNDIYDRCRIIKKAASLCREDKEKVLKLVPYLRGAVFGKLSTNRWTTAEKDFMESLLSASQSTGSIMDIIDFPREDGSAGLSFFKARGISNEVRHAVEKMKKIAEKESFGTISVYYSSSEYNNFLKAVLDAERIDYCVTEGKPTEELHLTQFIISLLNAAEKDYSYGLLEKVVRNRLITFDNVLKEQDEEDEDAGDKTELSEAEIANGIAELSEEEHTDRDSVKVNPIRGYRHALSAGIGWGKERYLKYYERVKNDVNTEENEKIFARFLYDFAEVFDEEYSIGEIYGKLLEFVRRYTYTRNPEKTVLNNALYQRSNDLMLIDSSGYSLGEKISFIRNMIENMKVEDITEKGEAVCIFPIRDLFLMERKHNFILGLSATGFSADGKQSPLLLDEEKKMYILGAGEEDSPVKIASDSYEILSVNLKKSLCTRLPDSDVSISYPYYDSKELRVVSPSVLFIELSNGKEIEEAPGYLEAPYIVKDDIKLSVENLKESILRRSTEIEKKREEKRAKREGSGGIDPENKEKGADDKSRKEFSISASGIQTLLGCPLKYYYQYLKYLRDDDKLDPQGHEWLDFRNKGNLCHYTLEKYMAAAKNPAGGIEQPLFDEAYERSLKEIEEVQPVFSDEIKEREAESYKEKIKAYITFLSREWAEDLKKGKEWKVMGCELSFGNNDKTGKLKPFLSGKEKDYRIYLNGSIDRVDAYMDESGKLLLRIIDYKTGMAEKKAKEIDQGTQIQHFLYAMALRDYVESDAGKEQCRKLFGKDYKDYDFEWVGYTFPYEEHDEDRLLNILEMLSDPVSDEEQTEPEEIDVKDRIAVLPDDIMTQIDDIIGNLLTGQEDLISGKMDKYIHTKRKERKEEKDKTPGPEMSLIKFCDGNYCNYKPICRNWMGYTEKDAGGEEE